MKRVSTEYKTQVDGFREIKGKSKGGRISESYNTVYELTMTVETFHRKKFIFKYGKPELVDKQTYKFYKHPCSISKEWNVLTPFDTEKQSYLKGQTIFKESWFITPTDAKDKAIKDTIAEFDKIMNKQFEDTEKQARIKIDEENAQYAQNIINDGNITRSFIPCELPTESTNPSDSPTESINTE